MTKVRRKVVADGGWFCIECAVRADLSSPSAEALDQLRSGAFPIRQDEKLDSLDGQVSAHYRFLAGMQFLAEEGELPRGTFTFNALEDGIWELKPGSLRITYFDTDGNGNHTPKWSHKNFVTHKLDWPDDYDAVSAVGYSLLEDKSEDSTRRIAPSEQCARGGPRT